MGYFNRKRDRGRSRKLIRALNDRVLDPGAERLWDVIPEDPPGRECFLRFSVRERNPDSHRRVGILTAAFDLLDEGELEPEIETSLHEVLNWFDEHLDAPENLSVDAAIFFFKSGAHECIRRIWELVWLLKDSGISPEMQRVERAGRVVYEDEHQVAAIPWADSTGL